MPIPFQPNVRQTGLGVPEWRKSVEQHFDDALTQGASIRDIVHARADAMDALLGELFNMAGLDKTPVALFAVGGYGRAELSPCSDIDILLLSPASLSDTTKSCIERFAAKLWDARLEPGLSVRTTDECLEAAKDLTVATSLLESRLLHGNDALSGVPKKLMQQVWTDKAFYEAKQAEQRARYKSHNKTEYNLEPNIKSAPGGLRDIQHIGWICKCFFRIKKLSDLVHQNFLTNDEYNELEAAENFLWLVRHHLHRAAGRAENRLLFDFQCNIATRLGYHDIQPASAKHPNAPIEAMMRDYYRSAMRVSTLNEMLSAYYLEALIEPRLPDAQKPKTVKLSADFVKIGDKIACAHSKVFFQRPSRLLELFVLMGKHDIKEIRAKTLRLVKASSTLIDDDFRQNPTHQHLFMQIISEPNFLFHRLRKMKRCGILGAYLPAFGRVIGLMQYDLFHRYTVDAHTLLLMRMLHRFTDPSYSKIFNTAGPLYTGFKRKELIHLAALFHDIAKGRGGNHSKLGAQDAYVFCISHGLCQADAALVSWLVNYHLLMSLTAQKRDISDPDVVQNFVNEVETTERLEHLYVLTVADMNATNSELWNSWRASLLRQLYVSARGILISGSSPFAERDALVAQTKTKVIGMLSGCDMDAVRRLWEELGDDYFYRETADEIAWHTQAILAHDSAKPLICLRKHQELALDAVEVLVYTQDKPNLFATTVNVFNKMDLNVQDARVMTASRDFALDTYVLIDKHGTLLTDSARQILLINAISQGLMSAQAPQLAAKRMPRQLKHFRVETCISHRIDQTSKQNELTITTLDQPGILALIGCVFINHDVEIHAARITTLGERAEDVFLITDREDALLNQEKIDALIYDLQVTLENNEVSNPTAINF